jgi:hypothetical protein
MFMKSRLFWYALCDLAIECFVLMITGKVGSALPAILCFALSYRKMYMSFSFFFRVTSRQSCFGRSLKLGARGVC